MRDEKTLSAAYRVLDDHNFDPHVWEKLQREVSDQLFRELKPGEYYTIKLVPSVRPTPIFDNFSTPSSDYRIDIGLNRTEQKRVRMYTVEDMPDTALMKTAIQEVKSRLRRWARAWWKNQQKGYMPWTWA